jgi:hypothetical protein
LQAHVLLPSLVLQLGPGSPKLARVLLQVVHVDARRGRPLLGRLECSDVYLSGRGELATLLLETRVAIPEDEIVAVGGEDGLCGLDGAKGQLAERCLELTPCETALPRKRTSIARTTGLEPSAASERGHF